MLAAKRTPNAYQELRAWAISVFPPRMHSQFRNVRRLLWEVIHPRPREVPFEDDFPWSSPNVWQRVVDFYALRCAPTIFEYGTGVSSVHHIRNLLPLGGTYLGAEHDADWFVMVIQAIVRYCIRYKLNLAIEIRPVELPGQGMKACDALLRISTSNGENCFAKLMLRHAEACRDPEGATFSELCNYIRALREACDVVIIDGAARKACVNYVLDTDLLKPGGLLALFEAGRGMKNWLGRPTLTGERSYQPEVQRMLDLGAKICDGSGLDSWPGMKWRRTIGREALSYPAEACFLIRPPE